MFSLDSAFVYDIECFPNAFTLHLEFLNSDFEDTFEISEFKNDMPRLIELFNWCQQNQIPMIGFNSIHYDYPIIHFIFSNPQCTYQQIYEKSQSILNSFDNRFAHVVWANKRFAPQIDVFKINHFDNKAKSTGLKSLQINMRSESVVESAVPFGTILTAQQIHEDIIPYNRHDVKETKKFTNHNMEAINFRISLIKDFGIDVLNWNDTKIGSSMMEIRLGDEVCYDRSTGRKNKRQTPRTRIAVNDIIFPYVHFEQPEFNRVLNYLRGQVLTSEDMYENEQSDEIGNIKTKGVFADLKATINDFEFYFGTGGIHGSVSSQRIIATQDWLIRDIDVAALYPSIAIVNGLYPEHLGQRFSEVYSQLPKERKEWQEKKGKKCVEANALKLASNGVYGNSNNKFSVFYDPKFTMTITINGQLMLCMLAEQLMKIPTLKIIQINTDGITYYIHKDFEPIAAAVCKAWEQITRLTLEDTNYKRMWIRDVNNYIAESFDGSLKLKGAYWSPDPLEYAKSISNQQPPAWHRDLGNVVTIRAAVAAMVYDVNPEHFIRACRNPYDFMCRIKVNRSDKLIYKCPAWGDLEQQKNTRYYITKDGGELIKYSPPTGPLGTYKKASGIADAEYARVMVETGGQWDERVCTKNKSVHVERLTNVQAGYKVNICNNVSDFRFETINYDYYINEAKKLIISS